MIQLNYENNLYILNKMSLYTISKSIIQKGLYSLKKITNLFCLLIIITLNQSCKQSDPLPIVKEEPQDGLLFSGLKWEVKSGGDSKLGPGPNYFSDSTSNVFVDNQGYLHLKITLDNGKWNCAEVISREKFGYGTYVFTIQSNVANIDRNAVVGLFTWDNTSFFTQANSEVDIEFSKWGSATDTLTLTYSVQPVWFSNPVPYWERSKRPTMSVSKLKFPSTHAFTWTDSLITWKSYEGVNYPGNSLLSNWSFDKTKPPRIKIEGNNQSQPVVIPGPGQDTHARINLWLLNGLGPSNNNEVELIVKEFKFIPL
jgi:hypothetical protein